MAPAGSAALAAELRAEMEKMVKDAQQEQTNTLLGHLSEHKNVFEQLMTRLVEKTEANASNSHFAKLVNEIDGAKKQGMKKNAQVHLSTAESFSEVTAIAKRLKTGLEEGNAAKSKAEAERLVEAAELGTFITQSRVSALYLAAKFESSGLGYEFVDSYMKKVEKTVANNVESRKTGGAALTEKDFKVIFDEMDAECDKQLSTLKSKAAGAGTKAQKQKAGNKRPFYGGTNSGWQNQQYPQQQQSQPQQQQQSFTGGSYRSNYDGDSGRRDNRDNNNYRR